MIRLLVYIVLILLIPRFNQMYFGFPDAIYYGFFLLVSFYCILRGDRLKISFLFLPFLLAIPLSLCVNDVPALFRAPVRAVAFLAVAVMVGPFVYNNLFRRFRKELFVYVLALMRWVVLASFAGYLLKLGMVRNGSGFSGFTHHSMLLGPIAGVVVLNYLYWIYISENDRSRILNGLKMLVSFLVLILAASRSAAGACFLGVAFFLLSVYRTNLFRLMKVGMIGLLLAASTVSLWWPYTERMREKFEYGEEMGSSTASRDALWTDRINEIRHYPLFGVGFASYNLDMVKDEKFDRTTGRMEPGSSWLFLLSSMGLVGFLSFLFPSAYLLYRAFKLHENRMRNAFLGSLLVMFMAHMLFEGYIVASGAYLGFWLWLIWGECYLCLVKLNDIQDGVDTGTGCLPL